MISLLVASLMIPYSVLADDCTIVKNAWAAMGKPAVSSTTSCCTMTGVWCSKSTVTGIDWSGQGLTGSIPSTLGNLTKLTQLWLQSNQLTGSIPSTLGNLILLTGMSLDTNQLSGPIPDSFGNLAQLTQLSLDTNQLSGPIPDSFGKLTKLTELWLQYNQLTGYIPASLGNLVLLTGMSLQNNQLSGPIPDSLGKLTKLTQLWLHYNKLSGSIPSSMGNLVLLTGMSLEHNQLTGPIPDSFGKLTKLTELSLNSNQLSGNIPVSIGSLTSLTELWLHDNYLTGAPSSLANLVNCKMLLLLPNPMSLIPYDVHVKNPVSTMSVKNLTDFLAISKKVKRQTTSTVATLTTDQLLALCPLNDVANKDILAGCVAGIVYFCKGQTDLTQCQRYYDTVFANSIFAPIGANCPAWKYGSKSSYCTNAVNSINVDLTYTTVTKDFASFFANTLFANTEYAPCNSAVQKCTW